VLVCLFFPILGHCGGLELAAQCVVTNLLESADLKAHFHSIGIGTTNIVLRYHTHGLRYKRTICDEKPAITKYGEEVSLSIEQSMRMASKGVVLMLEGVSEGNRKGVLITQKTDLRSLGGKVEVKRALLVLEKDGKSVGQELVLENVEPSPCGSNRVY